MTERTHPVAVSKLRELEGCAGRLVDNINELVRAFGFVGMDGPSRVVEHWGRRAGELQRELDNILRAAEVAQELEAAQEQRARMVAAEGHPPGCPHPDEDCCILQVSEPFCEAVQRRPGGR